MKLCENCIHDLGVETQADGEMPFPKLTVLGSLRGVQSLLAGDTKGVSPLEKMVAVKTMKVKDATGVHPLGKGSN